VQRIQWFRERRSGTAGEGKVFQNEGQVKTTAGWKKHCSVSAVRWSMKKFVRERCLMKGGRETKTLKRKGVIKGPFKRNKPRIGEIKGGGDPGYFRETVTGEKVDIDEGEYAEQASASKGEAKLDVQKGWKVAEREGNQNVWKESRKVRVHKNKKTHPPSPPPPPPPPKKNKFFSFFIQE